MSIGAVHHATYGVPITHHKLTNTRTQRAYALCFVGKLNGIPPGVGMAYFKYLRL